MRDRNGYRDSTEDVQKDIWALAHWIDMLMDGDTHHIEDMYEFLDNKELLTDDQHVIELEDWLEFNKK